MPSPFPGMDPYLEDPSVWMDFHESFITYCRDFIISGLPDEYDARIEERIHLVRQEADNLHLFRADVAVSREPGRGGRRPTDSGGTLTLDPVTIPMVLFDEVHESNVHIVRRSDRKLITVVELLSPTNKSGDGMAQYHSKRGALITSRVHLVEIDLLVAGERPPLRQPYPPGDYCVLVSRGEARPNCDVFLWSVQQPLPRIPIPLEAPDPDLLLDLAELFRTTYDRGRYERVLQYHRPLPPVFAREIDSWAQEFVRNSSDSEGNG